MFKKLISTLSLIIASSSIANASVRSVTSEQVLPNDLEVVLNFDMKQSTQFGNILKNFAAEDGDKALIELINAGTRNKITVGTKSYNNSGEFEDVYISVKMTNTQFKRISHAFGESNGVERKTGITDYWCNKNNGGCFTRLGEYFYITNDDENMNELMRNFVNGERDVIGQNTDYIASQKLAVKNAAFDGFVDFDIFTEEVTSTLEDDLYLLDKSFLGTLIDIIESIEYESFSASVSDTKTAGRFYLKHNISAMQNLPFAYKDFMFQPSLSNFVDANNMLFYFEGNNLAKRFDLLGDLRGTMGEDFNIAKKFFKLLDGRNAFSVRYSEEDIVPRITFMAEIRGNNARKAKEAIQKVVEAIEENNTKTDAMYAELEMENPNPMTIKVIKEGLYEFNIVLDEFIAEEIGVDSVTIKFGINNNNILLISNDITAGERHDNTETEFKDNVQGPKNIVGVGFGDFQELHHYLINMNDKYELGIEEEVSFVGKLELLTMKVYANTNSVKLDVALTYNLADVFDEIFDTIENELYFY